MSTFSIQRARRASILISVGLSTGVLSQNAFAQEEKQEAAPKPAEAKKSETAPGSSTAAASTEAPEPSEPPEVGKPDAARETTDPFDGEVQGEGAASAAPSGSEAEPPGSEGAEPEPTGEEGNPETADADHQNEAKKQEPKVDYASLPWTYHLTHIDVVAGVGLSHTADDGLAPFLEAPVLAEGFVRAGAAVWKKGRFSIAPLVEFGGSRGSATARDWDSQVAFLHVTGGVEPRFYLLPRLSLHARVMVGAEHTWAEFDGHTDGSRLRDEAWGLRADGNLGASVRVAGSPDGRKRTPRLWITLEGGYRFSTQYDLELATDEESGPARAESLPIESYASSGFRGALSVMGTF